MSELNTVTPVPPLRAPPAPITHAAGVPEALKLPLDYPKAMPVPSVAISTATARTDASFVIWSPLLLIENLSLRSGLRRPNQLARTRRPLVQAVDQTAQYRRTSTLAPKNLYPGPNLLEAPAQSHPVVLPGRKYRLRKAGPAGYINMTDLCENSMVYSV
jgi:hypothetical protein